MIPEAFIDAVSSIVVKLTIVFIALLGTTILFLILGMILTRQGKKRNSKPLVIIGRVFTLLGTVELIIIIIWILLCVVYM